MGGNLVCCGPDLTRYHMELRGLGIINIKDLFGVAAVRHQKNLEMVVRLDPWKEGKEYDRLGVDQQQYEILGMKVAYMEMPVAPGRNLSMLIEVACRNQLLKLRGYHPAQELARRLNERIGREEQRQEKGQGPVPAEEPADIAMSVTPDGAADELSPMDEDLEDDG
jgi:HPr kinase/phosphorylase